MDYNKAALEMHESHKGKVGIGFQNERGLQKIHTVQARRA